eukprot:gnl/Dysnectes_brevis/167_a194_5561.p2 GENE.gnl/Dysnectes_brevis/167_a194_5561~~gnl/Dysnectes_brevis/167_a194_5561.p2  ORF type:complete len:124 (+),score=46.61 gnl/Dysnectes_brevis/167_a194_5561:643-1014(+)
MRVRQTKPRTSLGAKRYIIDCSVATPLQLNLDDFVDFLKTKFKVNGKAGALGDAVTISSKYEQVVIESTFPFSKKYVKYLAKKYLCAREEFRDVFRILATSKDTYTLSLFADYGDEEEEEEEA